MVGEDRTATSTYGTNMNTPIRIPGLDLVNPPSPPSNVSTEKDDDEEYEPPPPEDIFAQLQSALNEPAPPRVVSQTPQPSSQDQRRSDGEAGSSSSEEGGVSLPMAPMQSTMNTTAHWAPAASQYQGFTYGQANHNTVPNQAAIPHPTFEPMAFFQPSHPYATTQPQYAYNQAWANPFATYGEQDNFGAFAAPTTSFTPPPPPSWPALNNQWALFGAQNLQAAAQSSTWQASQDSCTNGQVGQQREFNTYSTQKRYSLRSLSGRQARPDHMEQSHVNATNPAYTTDAITVPPAAAAPGAAAPTYPPKRRERPLIQNAIPRPIPTKEYMNITAVAGPRLIIPKKLLVITDLNGTLLYRPNVHNNPKRAIPRPSVNKFLDYLFKNHTVMVWSSARPPNVAGMCQNIFTAKQLKSLVGCWARDTLRLSPANYNSRVQVYKQLSWVWDNPTILKKNADMDQHELWDQTNTVLLDDSIEKAAAEPHNLIQIPEWAGSANDDILSQIVGFFEELKYASNASEFMRRNPFKVNSGWAHQWA
jgi:NLI interacting factor-like phosphatase